MSTWYDIENQEDVDLSDNGKEIHVLFGYDRDGNKYISIPIEFVKSLFKGGS